MEPTVRFPEFKGSWNNYKIEDMFDRVGTPVDLDDTQTYREIGIRSHGKGIFHKEETTATEIGNKRVFWVEPDCFVVNIVFAWERAVAKTTEKENGMIASHRFPMYKPKKDVVDLDYITEYFITKRGQNVLILASPGGAGRNKTLGQKEFAKSIVKLPSLPEQQKIADFLSTIDTVIEKQKETVSAWEERKKGVMQKLFSQEVRFKADDGSNFPEWEEKKLGEVGDIVTGNTPSTKQNDYYGECYLWVTPTDITDSREVTSTAKMLTELGYTVARHIPANSILVTCIASIGKNAILRENGSCNQQINSITPYDEYSVEFVYYLICQNEKLLHANAGTGGMEILNKENFSKIKMYFPCFAEQQKIADCLSSLDEVIEKQKATLAAWEELKKGLLQQMFV